MTCEEFERHCGVFWPEFKAFFLEAPSRWHVVEAILNLERSAERERCASILTSAMMGTHEDAEGEPGDPDGCRGFCSMFGCGSLRRWREQMLNPGAEKGEENEG